MIQRRKEFIQKTICSREHVLPKDVHTKSRKKEVREVRQIIIYYLLQNGATEADAAEFFGLDHATSNHTKKVISDMCFSNKDFREKIQMYDELFSKTKSNVNRIQYLEDWLEGLKKDTRTLIKEIERIAI